MKKSMLMALGVIGLLFVVTASSFAAWDKPCNKRQILEVYWCKDCKEVRRFTECSEIGYIWDFKKHQESGDKSHTDLPLAWGCLKIAYSCINPECAGYGACIPHPGICEVCMDDITSKQIWSKANFKCPKCGEVSEEPGKGFVTRDRSEPVQLEKVGDCEHCGVAVEVVCEKSGTCPHVSR